MTPLVSFLLKANSALILLYGFYFLFFRRDTFYGQIRWYLLATMISVITFPLIDISSWLTDNSTTLNFSQYIPTIDVLQHYVSTQPQIENAVEPANVRTIPYSSILTWSWISVAAFLIGRRIFQFECIIRLWRRYPKNQQGDCIIVAVEKDIQPFSFIRYIFLNPALHTKDELDEIITHEQVHCRQGHTFDILLVEILVCLFWFNPLAWLLRYDIKQNIEYYTDRKTLMSGFDRKHYQYSLLRVSDSNIQIVNHFHFNNIKKRIIMMNKKESPRIMSAKYLLVFPVLAAVLLTVQISGLQAQESKSMDDHIQNIISKSSSDKPLIVVDGKVIPNEETSKLDPVEIESIAILKKNSEKAVYGEAGKSGVILITTKSETTDFSTQARLEAQKRTDEEIKSTLQSINPSNSVRVSGTVTDKDGKALPGVSIVVKETTTGTVTDMNGKYVMDVPVDATLKFAYINMNSLEVSVENHEVINVSLESADKSSDEVEDVDSEKISATYMLEKNYDFEKISERINAELSENTTPLFIVNKKEVNGISDINPDNILLIAIYKDESAIKLYGDKGKNGVVSIMTIKKQE